MRWIVSSVEEDCINYVCSNCGCSISVSPVEEDTPCYCKICEQEAEDDLSTVPWTIFEQVQNMNVEDMAAFCYGLIDGTEEKIQIALNKAGIKYDRITPSADIQIAQLKRQLLSPWRSKKMRGESDE